MDYTNTFEYIVTYSTLTAEFCLIPERTFENPEDLMEMIVEQGFVTNLDQICRIKVYSKGILVYNIQP